MGLYDNVRCRYPLPDQEAQDFRFQTKSTPAPYLDDYEITEDGRRRRCWNASRNPQIAQIPPI